MSAGGSLRPDYFDGVYAANADPWDFTASPYEAEKYAATMDALPVARYRRALEIGCSIGVFTRMLADRCDALLALDVSEAALDQARRRCADLPHVQLARMQVPQEFPPGPFDLVTLCEVGYYWTLADLDRAFEQIHAALEPGGTLLLVHWTPPVHDYPLTGDAVHERALALAGFEAVSPSRRASTYRMDVLRRR